MNLNDYLDKTYDEPRCWNLVADVYAAERDQQVDGYQTINNSVRAFAAALRIALHKSPHGFIQITEPAELCVVLMGRSERTGLHHCGIFFEGGILHALDTGPVYQDMASVRDAYGLIEYWERPA